MCHTCSICHKPYQFDLDVKGQHRIGIINIREISSPGDRHMCQRKMLNQENEYTRQIISWWYTHGPNMVSQCQTKKSIGRTQKHDENPINLTLKSKVKLVSGSWMYATHRFMVIHPYAKIWYAYVKSKDILQNWNPWWKYNFDIEVKGQGS